MVLNARKETRISARAHRNGNFTVCAEGFVPGPPCGYAKCGLARPIVEKYQGTLPKDAGQVLAGGSRSNRAP